MTGTVTATGRLAVVAYDAPGLGDRSYLLHDGNKALVVDPQDATRTLISRRRRTSVWTSPWCWRPTSTMTM